MRGDPSIVHFRRTLRALSAEIDAHVNLCAAQPGERLRLSSGVRDRHAKLEARVRDLMAQIKRHQAYIEHPDDPAAKKCAGLYANAKGCLRRLAKAQPGRGGRPVGGSARSRDGRCRPPDPTQDAPEAERQERYEERYGECSVRTVSGGLPGLGRRRS